MFPAKGIVGDLTLLKKLNPLYKSKENKNESNKKYRKFLNVKKDIIEIVNTISPIPNLSSKKSNRLTPLKK
ncbi:MAG: hypothetical protein ABF274_10495 [Nonlabens sp.]|uniref:hypothetical protein n=1 Tax=Nonlabens sp. TaxID=1888209 RepID=UPI00321AF3D1